MSSVAQQILLIFALLLANGLFSMAELALISSRKARLQARAEDGDTASRTALKLLENPTSFLSTVQVGITLVGILAGALGGAELSVPLAALLARWPLIAPYSIELALALVVVLITYFTLVIGELIPKRLALHNPEAIARQIARPMQVLSAVMRPMVRLLTGSTNLGMRLLGIEESSDQHVTEDEVKVLIEQGTQSGVFEETEQDMVESVFRLSDRTVDAMMTPRTEITWLNLEDSYDELFAQVLESPYSRLPVGQGSLDGVVGILITREWLKRHSSGERPDLTSMLQPPLFVPDSTPSLRVMEMLRTSGAHVAMVIDEFGGVLGMVTLLDVLEAIMGDFHEPGVPMEPEVVRREDGSYLLDGLLQVDDLKDLLGLKELPEEEHAGYQTLGGFMMTQLGAIPTAGQHFEWNGLHFEVVDMDARRVDKVLVVPVKNKSITEPS
jgi:putative hemolysin